MRHSLRISVFVFLFSILIATIGCGGGSMGASDSSAQQKSPAIAFAVNPNTVVSGSSTMLTWSATNTNTVKIGGLGSFPAVGSLKVTPTTTTTYNATAVGPAGKTESSAMVQVTTSGAKPAVTFNAQPSNIQTGTSAILSWNTDNATAVNIAGLGTFAATGSVKVTPSSTSTYTATAIGPGGTADSAATVTVSALDPAPTISFNAQPSQVTSGGTAVLSWTTTNATSVNIPGLGSFPANGSTQVTPATTTIYAATAQGANGTANASATVTVKSNGTPLPNLQASSGWQSWGELPPDYNICSYPCPGIDWSMKRGITSPSKSGNATQFNISGDASYGDVLWSNPLIGEGSTQGLPDSGHTLIPSLHNFTYDAYFYPTNLGVTQVLEFDISMYFNGLGLVWGHQCNILGGHVWDIWDNVTGHWVSSGVPCNPINNAWNHLTLQVQRESDNWLLFQSITLNGVTTKIDKYYAPGPAPHNWYGVTVNFQMDGDHKLDAYTTFLDDFTFSYW